MFVRSFLKGKDILCNFTANVLLSLYFSWHIKYSVSPWRLIAFQEKVFFIFFSFHPLHWQNKAELNI